MADASGTGTLSYCVRAHFNGLCWSSASRWPGRTVRRSVITSLSGQRMLVALAEAKSAVADKKIRATCLSTFLCCVRAVLTRWHCLARVAKCSDRNVCQARNGLTPCCCCTDPRCLMVQSTCWKFRSCLLSVKHCVGWVLRRPRAGSGGRGGRGLAAAHGRLRAGGWRRGGRRRRQGARQPPAGALLPAVLPPGRCAAQRGRCQPRGPVRPLKRDIA